MEIGERHRNLVCIGRDPDKDSRYYLFKCDCGNVKSIIASNVKRGATVSCGCYQKGHPSHIKYGFSHTRIDNIYKSMVARCYSKTNSRYDRYGKRGIVVCDEWLKDKEKFFEWAFSHGYKDNLTIDRIDTDGNYTPDNCKWSTQKEQQNNRSNTIFLEYNGDIHTLAEWADITGIPYKTLYGRCHTLKWSAEKALTTPINT